MPGLDDLLRELRRLGASPSEIRLPGVLYDDLIEQVDDEPEENPGDDEVD